ncbi:MAG: DUF1499 domain-containing protein [Yoonia sp.]|uniref:DUF1499 domain-containing protein n=1 Tax=Yoonia sp. TaxID=2212373 RepID=UPI003EF333F6
MRILIALVVVVIGFAAYVRLAPTDVARWNRLPEDAFVGDLAGPGSHRAVRRITAPAAEVLQAVAQAAAATDRTRLIAGSVEDGMMTFVTRSRLWGFPDYTTVAVRDDLLVIYARLRFGSADLGVNRDRVDRWLAVLGPLTEPL